jgi:hypothetical protein
LLNSPKHLIGLLLVAALGSYSVAETLFSDLTPLNESNGVALFVIFLISWLLIHIIALLFSLWKVFFYDVFRWQVHPSFVAPGIFLRCNISLLQWISVFFSAMYIPLFQSYRQFCAYFFSKTEIWMKIVKICSVLYASYPTNKNN